MFIVGTGMEIATSNTTVNLEMVVMKQQKTLFLLNNIFVYFTTESLKSLSLSGYSNTIFLYSYLFILQSTPYCLFCRCCLDIYNRCFLHVIGKVYIITVGNIQIKL